MPRVSAFANADPSGPGVVHKWATLAEQVFMRAFLIPVPQLALAGTFQGVVVPGAGAIDSEPSSGEGLMGDFASLWNGILHMAVPKSRVTRSRKRIKNYRKRIVSDKKNIITCKVCGELKLMHHLCKGCLKAHKKEWPRERMEGRWKRRLLK